MKLTPRTPYEAVLDLPGFWAPSLDFDSGPAGATRHRELPVWPLRQVTGRLRPQNQGTGKPFPINLELRFVSPPGPASHRAVPASSVSCPVEPSGSFRCPAPAANLDLTVHPPGFVPHYLWGRSLRHTGAHSLGTIPLVRGASVAGWVRVAEGELPASGIVARLLPRFAGGGSSLVEERLRRTTKEAPVEPEGFFQLAGVPPGSYVVEVAHPRFAPARRFPVEVWGGRETVLRDPLELHPPSTLHLRVEPALDWLGKPWKLLVFRASDMSGGFENRPAYDGPADESGRVSIPEQSPGRYSVVVTDSLGNRFFSDRSRALSGPDDAEHLLEIDLVVVEGRVLLGDEPVEGTIWFGGRYGSHRAELAADEDGRFEGYLPRGGVWDVEIEAWEPERLSTSTRVVADPDSAGVATVRIRLPDNRVFGQVVFENGEPAPGARVTSGGKSETLVAESGADGRFELRAIPEGRTKLAARLSRAGARLSSEALVLQLRDGLELGPFTLSLQAHQTLLGRVQSTRGSIPGAVVQVRPLSPRSGPADTAQTDPQGRFAVQIPRGTERVSFLVSPPGHALTAFEAAIDGASLVLNVPAEGGRLHGRLPVDLDTMLREGLRPFLFQDGQILPTSALYHWAAGHGERFSSELEWQVPAVAPGAYTFCLGPNRALEPWELPEWMDRQARCASGYLDAGGSLQLDLSAEPR